MSISDSAIAGAPISGDGGATSVVLFAANCSQANTCTTGAVGIDGGGGPPVRSVTLQLVSPTNVARANLTGLRWAFFDSANFPALLSSAPVDSGMVETTDGSGSITIDLPSTSLMAGQTGWLIITTSDGTVTQTPPCMSFCAPVVVA